MITLWHNPRCSKSRAALHLLEENGAEVTLRRYLDDPPTRTEIADVLRKLDLPARDILRRGERPYRDFGLKEVDDEDRLIDAMAEHPILIERSIAIRGPRAVLGRPPENVLSLLD